MARIIQESRRSKRAQAILDSRERDRGRGYRVSEMFRDMGGNWSYVREGRGGEGRRGARYQVSTQGYDGRVVVEAI